MSGDFMAVIPARGGSKRAPRKNIRPLGEQPLLAYTIAAARDAGLGDATFVSTEDAEIAVVAKKLGCGVIPRPDALATELSDETLRAKAMLTVATLTADRGDKSAARSIAEGLTYPALGKTPLQTRDIRFVFRDPKTWNIHDWGVSNSGTIFNEKQANDLTAAAMRCWVAIEGKGLVPDAALLESWDLRKVARAQAAGGDRRELRVQVMGRGEDAADGAHD